MSNERIIPVYIEDEMKTSYIDYAMSVIVGRALPDVRDGLKPVHRRVLYAMREMGLLSNKPYKKSAGVVGEVLKNYHPHGDIAVYDTIVRLAQDFSSRYPLVDGQGNFGSVDGDPPAAMRYTEVRLTKIAEEMLVDIDKDTVDFMPNYDESTEEPKVLPAKVPNLLINGSSGIAVGMATNIPPHNLAEVIDGVIMLIDNPLAQIEDLMKVIKGPDFPTGAYILGKDGIKSAYTTGRGSIKMQAKAHIEENKGEKKKIIVNEIPYQVNKAQLISSIADLVKDKKIEGISDVRDESDRDGMRIVVEVKRDENPQVVMNHLMKHTQMRESFGIIMLALVQGRPIVLNLKEILNYYIEHRKDIVVRRTKFELAKAEKRAHILEGLRIALLNIDKVIKLIRSSKTAEIAKAGLMKNFKLSEMQAQAILDIRLQQLTSMEREKVEEEYKALLKIIDDLKSILASPKKVLDIIKKELLEMKEQYKDARRTEIIAKAPEEIKIEDLITEEDVVVTLSHVGYIKRLPVSSYKAQRRGGKGVTGMETKEEDFVEDMFITTTHETIIFFTNKGRCYWLKVYQIPEAGRYAKGKPIVNLLNISSNEAKGLAEEKISAAMPIKKFEEGISLVMATKQGIIKKTDAIFYSKPKSSGIIAIRLKDKDELVGVKVAKDKQEIILATHLGKAIRFKGKDVREIGRSGMGVRGIKLGKGDFVIGMEVVEDKADLLTVTSNGFGKRTTLDAYRVQGRGGKGIINIKSTPKTGSIVGILEVKEEDEIMIITTSGNVIRIKVKGIRKSGRSTQGVKVIRLEEKDKVSVVAHLAEKDEEE
jgi:DNA gyrase subunit A